MFKQGCVPASAAELWPFQPPPLGRLFTAYSPHPPLLPLSSCPCRQVPDPDPALLAELREMGFPQQLCRNALLMG